ncbi:Menaquinone biosynthesis protein; probable 2-succinyl-6-hydroxy-2,4-cyclohexadiene-1-carboxylate synthase [Prochlorococcus marinus str. MIT 9211]|uniref:2-succinyl-5-enolpyruvyl-6-hydroxy-3-cyclohexene-1-carboxylate synthase n=1 Tax=Prochlorococcus marinus (strain MIT 9211) TaxID=93059 RepID=A9BAW2_PROM4|nr:2-succinyl-5-enolpyruvyl-6-hydroxy-3-cyclohexene-1-carboxylic-acid synthase [Prochlorococcus marinus]ABX08974.1 Menaquinone biosynthesis protein; probable 2-succinyl-6-hydroxy-2,4-cyclohexadiene-1-carboxylate synthase [Prochlorococcus marinus str. MIT 9211]
MFHIWSFYPRIGSATPFSLSLARTNLFIAIKLLNAFQSYGMENLVLCSGSRSGPLAIAAGGLAESFDLKLYTAVDERSASFMALGLSAATGKGVIVITTSGSAVGNLLPAAIEADRSCHPIIFITADRPERLKNCGANQSVNQEEFLLAVSRSVKSGPTLGIHKFTSQTLNELTSNVWALAHDFPGPVHLNLPIEEPLLASFEDQKSVWDGWVPDSFNYTQCSITASKLKEPQINSNFPQLDPYKPGILIIGPWRGALKDLNDFQETVKLWSELTGWPVFADPLSLAALNSDSCIKYWEHILSSGISIQEKNLQILRLGPMPSSRILENWLKNISSLQVLITEGDTRPLDPLKIAFQYSRGFVSWYKELLRINKFKTKMQSKLLTSSLKAINKDDQIIANWLGEEFLLDDDITEPSLAYWLPKLLPEEIPIMLSASSPIRDWITFSGCGGYGPRFFYGFRGASGIDGTLSLAMGLSFAKGRMILITGDLALLHDINGWLFSQIKPLSLIIILIDNCGGGIFKQIHNNQIYKGDFNELFIMPQHVNHLELASAYKITSRQVKNFNELKLALDWSLNLSEPVLLRVTTNSSSDSSLRKDISYRLKEYVNESKKNST